MFDSWASPTGDRIKLLRNSFCSCDMGYLCVRTWVCVCVCVLYIINNTVYNFWVLSLLKIQYHSPWICHVIILQHWELNPGPPTFQNINIPLSYITALFLVFILIPVLTKFPRMALNSLYFSFTLNLSSSCFGLLNRWDSSPGSLTQLLVQFYVPQFFRNHSLNLYEDKHMSCREGSMVKRGHCSCNGWTKVDPQPHSTSKGTYVKCTHLHTDAQISIHN